MRGNVGTLAHGVEPSWSAGADPGLTRMKTTPDKNNPIGFAAADMDGRLTSSVKARNVAQFGAPRLTETTARRRRFRCGGNKRKGRGRKLPAALRFASAPQVSAMA